MYQKREKQVSLYENPICFAIGGLLDPQNRWVKLSGMMGIATLTKKENIEGADTESLCVGPEGRLYFMKYSENFAWYTIDENGEVRTIG